MKSLCCHLLRRPLLSRTAFLVGFLALLLAGRVPALAQEAEAGKPPHQQQPAASSQPKPADAGQSEGNNEARPSQARLGAELAQASREAAGEEDANAQFKQSPSVKWLASLTGLNIHVAYWISILLNFAVVAAAIVLLSRARLPALFRARTAHIKKAMEEAQRASQEANRRLAEIESRLQRLDLEIAAMREAAEREARAEEEHIQAAAQQDTRRAIETAEQEIAAAVRLARRELKAYAAVLAVSLAQKKIHVDARTDAELVRSFAEQLGNSTSGNRFGRPGKDGE